MKYYYCYACGNLVNSVDDSGMPVSCCGKEMKVFTSDIQNYPSPMDRLFIYCAENGLMAEDLRSTKCCPDYRGM